MTSSTPLVTTNFFREFSVLHPNRQEQTSLCGLTVKYVALCDTLKHLKPGLETSTSPLGNALAKGAKLN